MVYTDENSVAVQRISPQVHFVNEQIYHEALSLLV